ncbi:MAG: SpoIIE family protein phosphatase [Spirochaetales bacterium]|nr:SpoIIE family protein phosphatase [Spirochaetales bacterium]
MKLSVRFPLYQFIMFFLFSLSLALGIFVFREMNRLSNQKILLDSFHSNVLILNDELDINLYKPQMPAAGYYNLSLQLNNIESIVNELKLNQEKSLRESNYKSRTDQLIKIWENASEYQINPLLEELRNLNPVTGYYSFTVYGLKGSLRARTNVGGDSFYNQLWYIINLYDRLQLKIEKNLIPLSESTALLVNSEIDNFSRNLMRNALVITIVMLSFSIILSIYLSHSIAENINRLDHAIAQVASGNFHYTMKTSGNDEFSEISQGFNTLTEMLWFRIDSLKDIMRDVGSAVEKDSTAEELYTLILELAIDSTGADSAILMLYNEDADALTMGHHLGYFPPPLSVPKNVRVKQENIIDWFNSTKVPMTGNILGDSCHRGSSFYIHDNEQQRVLPENIDRRSSSFISSAIVLSLNSAHKKIGVLGLAKTSVKSFFSDLDFTYMKSFANFVTITMDNFEKYQELVRKHEINREVEVAAEIQSTLLPSRMPPMKGTKISAFSHAAKGVSGDYYDVFSLDRNRTAVIICDVSGKGIPASLFMVMFRTVLRTVSTPTMNASQILTVVNREISGNFQSGTFATASLLIINHSNNTISFSNGAHHPLYLYRSNRKIFVKFDTEGLPLGIDTRGDYGHKQLKVEKNDYLFLFTDGLTEARNIKGEELGTGRLLKYASQYIDKTPERMKDLIEELLLNFEGEAGQHDDETFMAIRIG